MARLLTEHPDRLERRAGRPIRWKWAAVRDPRKPREVRLDGVRVTTEVERIIEDPEVDVIIETMGGTDPALAIHAGGPGRRQGRRHGQQGAAGRARRAGLRPGPGARDGPWRSRRASGGGIPIVQCLGVALAANQVQGLAAIVNGTCNFILTRMTTEGLPYDEALRQAQHLGYAEADPTLDVDGTDTAHKLAILAQLAFEANVRLDDDPPPGDRPAPGGRPQVRRRARLRDQAPGAGEALDRPGWSSAWHRPWSGTGPRWRRSGAPTTPSASSATPSATRSSTAEAPARCPPPRRSSAT